MMDGPGGGGAPSPGQYSWKIIDEEHFKGREEDSTKQSPSEEIELIKVGN